MRLEDLLVMEVPTKQLRHIITINRLKPTGSTREDYAKFISSNAKLQTAAQSLVEEFQYAGKTAVRLFKPIEDIPEKYSNIKQFRAFLRDRYNENIFTKGIRVTPTESPSLYRAVEYNGKFYLSFVYLGKERRIFRNFEIVRERPQNVDFLVVHFNPLLLQVRVPAGKDKLFKQAFAKSLGINYDVHWTNYLALDANQIKSVVNKLSCGLSVAQHKMAEGPIDTITVTAKPHVSLAGQPEYDEQYCDIPMNSAKIEIPYEYSNGFKESISLKINQEGINFLSDVSEEIIDFVINLLVNEKFPPNEQVANTSGE